MIIDFKEIWQGRRGSIQLTKATRDYTRSFRAFTDNMLDGPAEILAETDLPDLLSSYADANGLAFDDGALATRVAVEQDGENPFEWTLVVEFSSGEQDVQQAQQAIENPLDRSPIFKVGFSRFNRVANTDRYGIGITASSGVPFAPLPEVDEARIVITMNRNELDLNAPLMLQYADAINSDYFLGYPPGTWKLSLEASAAFENGLYYWSKTYTFEYRPLLVMPDGVWSAWEINLLDASMGYLDANGKYQPYLTNGVVPNEPQLLNGAGGLANIGVTRVSITDPGSGYTGPVTIGFGSGAPVAQAVATMIDDGKGRGTQKVGLISVTNPGGGYTIAPTVTIIGTVDSKGSPATATATIGKIPTWLHFGVRNWLPYSVLNVPPIQ